MSGIAGERVQPGDSGARRYRFEGVRFDPRNLRLTVGGDHRTLRAQTARVLEYLVRNPDRVVEHDEILSACWPDTAVTPDTLVQSIVEIRRLLGDSARDPRFVETVHGVGYRFVAKLDRSQHAQLNGPRSTQASRRVALVVSAVVLAGAGLLAVVGAWRTSPLSFDGLKRSPGSVTALPERPLSDSRAAVELYERAVELGREARHLQALDLLDEALQLDPEFAAAYARKGYIFAITWGRPLDALAPLERAMELRHRLSEPEARAVEGWQLIARSEFDSAISVFRRLVERDPTGLEARVTLANLLLGEDQLDKALPLLEQALASEPRNPWLHNRLGSLHQSAYNSEGALYHHGEYVRLAPNDPNAHHSLGLSRQWFGDYAGAIASYERALEVAPDFLVARRHLAAAFYQTGRYRAAERELERNLELATTPFEPTWSYQNLSLIALRRGELARARELADLAVGSDPAAIARLRIALDTGDLATALPEFRERIGATGPDRGRRFSTRRSLVHLGRLAMLQDRPDEALAHLREALTRRPMHWEPEPYEDALGRGLLLLGRYDEAIVELERVLAINPRYPLAEYHIALAHQRAGRPTDARQAFERFLAGWREADPDLPSVRAARAALAAR